MPHCCGHLFLKHTCFAENVVLNTFYFHSAKEKSLRTCIHVLEDADGGIVWSNLAEESGDPHYENLPMQYTEFFLIFTENFLIFLLNFAQNTDCGYTLEPPQQGGSNEYPQSMF